MQVDDYSLDAQKDKLHKYADYQDMIIAGEYSDEGKSGKSVEGRPQFQQMLQDIESCKDNIDFVLVFKLSRLDKLYDEIEEIETLIEEVETSLYNIRQEKISGDNVYQFLLFFDKLYDRFTDIEKKTL